MSADGRAWSEHAATRLAEAGLQRSRPRQAVIDFLAGRDCAVTALEIDASLDRIGRATVYRAIEQLERLDLVRRVDIGGSALGYERVDPSGHHHHHLVCDRCGRVFPFESEQLEQAVHAIQHPDFTVEAHEVTLRGLCNTCRQAES